MELSIIYVNWNSVDYLRESITSVYAHTERYAFEIIVVDNASPSRGVEDLARVFPAVRFIQSEVNLGFAGANNIGFLKSKGAYVLFLNPDTELVNNAIDLMMDQIKRLPDAGVIGCKLLNSDRSVQLTSVQKLPTILNQLLDAEYLQLRWPSCPLWDIAPLFDCTSEVTPVEVISGACMLLRREVLRQVGMLSEEYFMYAEDIDLNYKVCSAGFTNYYIHTAVIVHHGGKSSSQHQANQWATIMKYRAMRRLFHKMGGQGYGILYQLAIAGVAAVRLALLLLAYPFGGLLWSRNSIRCAAVKWRGILQWAIGRHRLAINDQ